MKIIATGDWHLGNIFHGNDRLDEHRHFLSWLISKMEEIQPEALLVAGDVFDNGNPSAASQNAYYSFLADASRRCPMTKIIITAGNHDSPGRLEAPRPMLECCNIEVRGNLRYCWIPDSDGILRRTVDFDDLMIPLEGTDTVVLAVPYLRSDIAEGTSYSKGVATFLKDLTTKARDRYPGKRLIMMAHLYAKGSDIAASDASEKIIIGGQEQVSLSGWDAHPDYLTCGHIHKRQHIWDTKWARYSGSILPMSFAEKDYKHGVDLISFDEYGHATVEQLVYKPKHSLRVLPYGDEQLTVKNLKDLIQSELPDKKDDGISDDADYVLIKVRLDKDDSEAIRELDACVTLKNAILCKIQKIIPQLEIHTISGNTEFTSIDEVINRDPIRTIEETFSIKKGRDLSQSQRELLLNLISELNISDES